MNHNDLQNMSIEEFKIQASILMKKLQSDDSASVEELFKQLPEFKDSDLQTIQKQVKRKHALRVIAQQNDFDSWDDLKTNCAQALANTFVKAYAGGHLNKWFANYNDAKTEQKIHGGFLLPYKHQFFICDADYLAMLGLNPNDPEWSLIEFDWVRPANIKAWQRLLHRWLEQRGELT